MVSRSIRHDRQGNNYYGQEQLCRDAEVLPRPEPAGNVRKNFGNVRNIVLSFTQPVAIFPEKNGFMYSEALCK